jgi:hypothetical protein
MLYDKKFINKLPEMKQFENPWLVGICKFEKNQELKKLVEKWYANIPIEHQAKLKTKLRSIKDSEFVSAFYELVAHQYCLEEGWEVEYEPRQPSGKAPDFLVKTKSGYEFILEVATIFDSADVKSANDKKEEVTHAITIIKTPFKLHLEYKILPDSRVEPKEVAKLVKEWLEKLDPNDTKKKNKMGFGYKSLSVMVEAIIDAPKPSMGCVLSVMDPGGQVPDYSERIKSVLDDKSKKYSSKKTKLPLVVMVGDGVGRIRMSESTIDRTLFGRDMITFGDEKNPPHWHKDRSGHFTPSNDENFEWFGKRTGLSAVLYCSLKEKGSFQMQVFHNPIPHIQLSEEVFYKMPQLLKWENKQGIVMRWVVSNPEGTRIQFN